jgi:hypothetical protein
MQGFFDPRRRSRGRVSPRHPVIGDSGDDLLHKVVGDDGQEDVGVVGHRGGGENEAGTVVVHAETEHQRGRSA